MEASQHSLLAACFTLHSINATLAIVPQRGAGLWINDRKEWASVVKQTKILGGPLETRSEYSKCRFEMMLPHL
jgi:hypothetical protein